MNPYRGIPRSDSGLCCQVVQAAFFDVDDAQGIAVIRLERVEQAGNAVADFLFQLGFRSLVGDKLLGPAFERAFRGCPVAIMIDDGVAEHPVKPRNGTFFVAHFGATLQAPDKGRLQDVFGDGSGFDAGFEEGQELAVTIDQALDGGGRESGGHEASVMFRGDVRQPL